jgi:hypothetical protein
VISKTLQGKHVGRLDTKTVTYLEHCSKVPLALGYLGSEIIVTVPLAK